MPQLAELWTTLTIRDKGFKQGISGAERKLQNTNKNMEALRRVGRRAFIAVGAAAALAVRELAAFEDQMAKVNTQLSGLGETRLPAMRQEVGLMAVEFGESTATISQGLFDILSASVEAGDAMEVLRVSMQAAAAGATDTGTAADAVTTILNAFRLSASAAADVSDFLFITAKRGKTDFARLAPQIGAVASIAAAAGLSLDEMGSALSTMTRAGVSTQRSVIALRAILSNFLKPQSEAAAAARKFGFELNTTTLRTEGLLGVLKKLQSLPPEAVANIFPNVRALAGLMPLLQNVEGFTEDMRLQLDRGGVTAEAFEKRTESLGFQLRQAWQATKQIARTFADVFAPAIRKVADEMQALGRAVTTLRHPLVALFTDSEAIQTGELAERQARDIRNRILERAKLRKQEAQAASVEEGLGPVAAAKNAAALAEAQRDIETMQLRNDLEDRLISIQTFEDRMKEILRTGMQERERLRQLEFVQVQGDAKKIAKLDQEQAEDRIENQKRVLELEREVLKKRDREAQEFRRRDMEALRQQRRTAQGAVQAAQGGLRDAVARAAAARPAFRNVAEISKQLQLTLAGEKEAESVAIAKQQLAVARQQLKKTDESIEAFKKTSPLGA